MSAVNYDGMVNPKRQKGGELLSKILKWFIISKFSKQLLQCYRAYLLTSTVNTVYQTITMHIIWSLQK